MPRHLSLVYSGIEVPPTLRVKRDKRTTTVDKVDSFLQGLEFKVYKATGELQVLSVYLDDDGAICIDVEEMHAPPSIAVAH